MSALSILYIVLPFVGVFALHEVEEILTAPRWAGKCREKHLNMPKALQPIACRYLEADKKDLWVTALEQLLLLVVITVFLLNGGRLSNLCWMMAFCAYSVHVLVTIGLAVAQKGYFPGLVTALLSLPFVCYGLYSISLVQSWGRIVLCAITGTALVFTNLMIVDSLLTKIMSKDGDEYHR